ncbi:Rieske 2Fe-2S domain-containing protein [Flavobacteriaceae bacterium]|nr:Rieske 2Fe-2S domain-containing protein [Flavobacteriaceae bacterium]
MKDRRSFLKTACKPIVLATLGIPILEACSSENDESYDYGSSGSTTSTLPSTDPLVIDISSESFKELQVVGGWINNTSNNILLVRISNSEIRVFDNKCPHQGNRNKWSYDGNNFECGYHGNSFSDNCSGALTCYNSSLEVNILTITF